MNTRPTKPCSTPSSSFPKPNAHGKKCVAVTICDREKAHPRETHIRPGNNAYAKHQPAAAASIQNRTPTPNQCVQG